MDDGLFDVKDSAKTLDFPKECVKIEVKYGSPKVFWNLYNSKGEMIDSITLPGYYDVDHALMDLKDRGWSIRRFKDGNGDAIVGPIARVDFHLMDGKNYIVSVYPQGWTASTLPMRKYTKLIEDLPAELRNLETMGFTVFTWDFHNRVGARAFRGEPMPVRSKSRIERIRYSIKHSGLFDHSEISWAEWHIDLKFML